MFRYPLLPAKSITASVGVCPVGVMSRYLIQFLDIGAPG
jgi:hypothetical protein